MRVPQCGKHLVYLGVEIHVIHVSIRTQTTCHGHANAQRAEQFSTIQLRSSKCSLCRPIVRAQTCFARSIARAQQPVEDDEHDHGTKASTSELFSAVPRNDGLEETVHDVEFLGITLKS
jgi:hypothetical protein